jgi:hypothetical protein
LRKTDRKTEDEKLYFPKLTTIVDKGHAVYRYYETIKHNDCSSIYEPNVCGRQGQGRDKNYDWST